jgi:tetratricopeptide (TPR) repeat protein
VAGGVRVSLTAEQQQSWDRGVNLSKEGQLEEAQAVFDMLADMLPSSAPVWLAKGINLNNLHRYEEALAAAEHGLALDALSSQGWCIKGNALYALKRYDEAAFAYFKALMFKFDTKIVPGALQALLLAGRANEVLTAIDKLDQFLLDKELVWHYRATALYNLGRYEEALEAIEKALEFGAGLREFDARLVQGNAHFYLGHDEEALAAYEQAIRIRPKDRLGWEGKLKVLRRTRRWRALWQGIKDLMAAKPRL